MFTGLVDHFQKIPLACTSQSNTTQRKCCFSCSIRHVKLLVIFGFQQCHKLGSPKNTDNVPQAKCFDPKRKLPETWTACNRVSTTECAAGCVEPYGHFQRIKVHDDTKYGLLAVIFHVLVQKSRMSHISPIHARLFPKLVCVLLTWRWEPWYRVGLPTRQRSKVIARAKLRYNFYVLYGIRTYLILLQNGRFSVFLEFGPDFFFFNSSTTWAYLTWLFGEWTWNFDAHLSSKFQI